MAIVVKFRMAMMTLVRKLTGTNFIPKQTPKNVRTLRIITANVIYGRRHSIHTICHLYLGPLAPSYGTLTPRSPKNRCRIPTPCFEHSFYSRRLGIARGMLVVYCLPWEVQRLHFVLRLWSYGIVHFYLQTVHQSNSS